ncbi:nucleotide pyrophosphohydrolase [Anaeromicrobium sediminis]|uniref:Nucleotide pyrophosphohydrolase n=1 Tax=Anaeromicrobium sediminis TaxID=1478221 RepID=A0A267MPJ0_9FIRM|nr:nucleotide pyrophosphohydrolase [Anaeromicrobium sediminis]PAB61352.1 nucleotide pyrophosphohydrolase [Anaeromicrobium sediminis]
MNTIDKLTKHIVEFRDERDWRQFHNPKDLALSLSLEASELLEIFQWKDLKDMDLSTDSPDNLKIKEEVADIANYILLICNELDIDLEEAILEKIERNRTKYPVEKSKGSAKKYTEL